MRIYLLLFSICLLVSCSQNNKKEKEIELKEKELALKQKELELKEREMNIDSTTNITNNTSPLTTNLTTEDRIVEIRNEFTRINSLRPNTKAYQFICDEKGEAIYYSENNKVVKIAIDWGYQGDYSSKSEYYYKNAKLIFSYEVTIGGPAGSKVVTNEYRTYVHNDKAIKTMENKKTVPCYICDFTPTSREYKFANATNANEIFIIACE